MRALSERLIEREQSNDNQASSNQPTVAPCGRAGACVCRHCTSAAGGKNEKKKKTKVRKGGSREKPEVLCFAVRCHCEFQNLSHLRGAKRILRESTVRQKVFI